MPEPKEILGHISADRVLDVATGGGGFIHFLIEGLNDYAEIIGVDNNDHAAISFAETFKENPRVHFQQMDAHHLDFPDSSFDLVSVSNSLHHLDPQPVLREMKRVLRPGGHILVSEVYCDNQTEAQMTHILLHHWWAAVDRVNGVIHNETYTRQQLIDLIVPLELTDLTTYDLCDLNENPHDPAIIEELAPVFERYIQRAEGHPDLQTRGAELRQRVEQVGVHSATTLVVIGRKA